MRSRSSGEHFEDEVDVGTLPDPNCKNTVASCAKGLVHVGSHSATKRQNISALFSKDGRRWGEEVMVWEAPRVGGYAAAQGFQRNDGASMVGVLREHHLLNRDGQLCGVIQSLRKHHQVHF